MPVIYTKFVFTGGAGLLYYLTFLGLKIKIAFIIGGVIALVLFFGKVWALVTYGKYMMGGKFKILLPIKKAIFKQKLNNCVDGIKSILFI